MSTETTSVSTVTITLEIPSYETTGHRVSAVDSAKKIAQEIKRGMAKYPHDRSTQKVVDEICFQAGLEKE